MPAADSMAEGAGRPLTAGAIQTFLLDILGAPQIELSVHREIAEVHAFLAPLTQGTLAHPRHPSGPYQEQHPGYLVGEGVITATTCEAGLNHVDTPAPELLRFMDGAHIPRIACEGDMSGFSEWLRRIRWTARRRGKTRSAVLRA
jgi:hypothetical protein